MLLAGLKRAINDALNDFQENRCIGCYRCARESLSIAIYVFHKYWIKTAITCLSLDQIFPVFKIFCLTQMQTFLHVSGTDIKHLVFDIDLNFGIVIALYLSLF